MLKSMKNKQMNKYQNIQRKQEIKAANRLQLEREKWIKDGLINLGK